MSFPAASASASPSPAPWPCSPAYWCSTNRPAPWMCRCRHRSSFVARFAASSSLGLHLHQPRLAGGAGAGQSSLVMKNGRVVEAGPARRVFEQPKHPYAKALL
ncbi:MAG: hypothetical protein R3F36_02470 [Candidatus Competibacteraceae bacterium]